MSNAHPSLPEFEYIKPDSLEAASKFLAENAGVARPFMGGTDVFVRMRDGIWKEMYLVDVKGLDGMNEISFDASRGISIGAAVCNNKISTHPDIRKHYPILAEAADSCASYQLRNRATMVGNICNASPAGDTIGACLLLDGRLSVHGVQGEREVSLDGFFKGPGETVLEAGDIVTAIHFPLPPDGFVGKYLKHGRNKASDLAIVGVTAIGYPHSDAPSGFQFRLALASVAPTPIEVKEVTSMLAEAEISAEKISKASHAAMDAVSPIDDVRGSAKYRKMMVRNLTRRALTDVWVKLLG
jgi:carbon-monoxide dehydrogenase medium subunit